VEPIETHHERPVSLGQDKKATSRFIAGKATHSMFDVGRSMFDVHFFNINHLS
jgi:hypothetical protein